MTVRKLSEIAAAASPPASLDTFIGVQAGPTAVQYSLSQVATSMHAVSVTAPANPQAGQIWFNPATQLVSVAEVPSYAWSSNLSAGNVALSGSNLTATRSDGSYPDIISPVQAGARSTSLLPTTQKYVFAITTAMNLAGDSGFGICDEVGGPGVGNSMFLGSPNPSHSIGYFVESLAFYYFVNNAAPLSGSSTIGNGVNYIAIDPVGKLMWVMPVGGNWNGNPANNPATGVGGVSLPAVLDVTTSRIIAQLWVNGDAATIDPAAAGLSAPAGFTPLSQIVLWTPLTYVNPSAISGGWVNIKDFGAVGDGVGEDGAAFQAFTKAYQGKSVILYIPPGTYQSSSNTLGLWSGIKQLTIFGYGASLGAGLNSFGGFPNTFGTANSALVASAFTGDTQLTLLSVGDASKFAAGNWVMLGALDTIGGGNPPSPHYMEFAQITSISGTTIFINNYLKGGPYLSTYPYYTNNASGVNEGGPATIYKMPPAWDADFAVYGVTFLTSNDMSAVRNLLYKDCKWPGLQSTNWPPSIQLSKSITFDHCLIQGGGEIAVDKDVERLTFRDCSINGYYNSLLFQSSSIQQLIIDGCDIGSLQGTPRKTYINNSWIGILVPTPRVNGVMESLDVENSYIGTFSYTGFGNAFGGAEPISNYTFANGTFSKANGVTVVPWACPGAKCIFQDSTGFYRSPPSFTVLAVRCSSNSPGAGTISIDTTLTTVPTWTQGTAPSSVFLPTLLVQHPYSRITFKNCRGDRNVMNWQESTNPTRDGGPGFQYAQLAMTGDTSGATGTNNMHAEGTIQSISINVLRAYSGANGTEKLNCANFQVYDTSFAGTAGITFVVDVKTAGLRTWSNGSWTGSVGADVLPVIAAGSWLFGYIDWFFDNSMAGDTLAQTPIAIIEIVTDVGIIKYPWIESGHNFIVS